MQKEIFKHWLEMILRKESDDIDTYPYMTTNRTLASRFDLSQ